MDEKLILIENVPGQGRIGDIITVRRGFARFLKSQKSKGPGGAVERSKKALRATAENIEFVEKQKHKINKKQAFLRKRAEEFQEKIVSNHKSDFGVDMEITFVRPDASEAGKLCGSIRPADILAEVAKAANVSGDEAGFVLSKEMVYPAESIRTLGIFKVSVELYSVKPAVSLSLMINVARSEKDAARQTEEMLEEQTKATNE